MKKFVLITAVSFVLGGKLLAQGSVLVNKDFWTSKPSLELVQKEVAKGFAWDQILGYDDPLLQAINHDAALEIVKFLADQPGIDFNRKIHDGRNYLHTTVGKNQVAITKYLIEKGANKDMLDVNGQTPLTFAASNANLKLDIIKLYEQLGTNLSAVFPKKDNATLLLLAIGGDKDLSMTKYLLNKGLDIKATDDKGKNAFYYAARYGNREVLDFILAQGVKPSADALFAAAAGIRWSAPGLETYKFLIEDLKLDAKVLDEQGLSLLNIVSKKNDKDDVIKYLLSKNVAIDKVDREGNTVLFNLARAKTITSIEAILPLIKDINIKNKKGETALMNAIQGGNATVAEYLISKGANINELNNDGANLTHYLMESYKAVGARGYRPGMNQIDEFEAKLSLLKKQGFNLVTPLPNGNTALILAASKSDIKLMELMVQQGIDINAQNEEGFTALHQAALVAQDDEILKFLIAKGAKKNLKTELSEDAYDLAKENEILTQKKINLDFLK